MGLRRRLWLPGEDDASSQSRDRGVLLPAGHLVVKLLQGSGSREFAEELREHFGRVSWVSPKASRAESREIFLVAIGRKPF